MKAIILSASCAALIAVSGFAQIAPRLQSPPIAPLVLSPESSGAPRFDLVFPGGTVRAFVTAVAKATGKPVNIIIPKESESAQIPAVEVSGVTLGSLLRAITSASQTDAPTMPMVPGFSGGAAPAQTASIRFYSEDPADSPDALWIFQSVNPPKEEPKQAAPAQPVKYFPIAQYLGHFTVDDITTAIQSGCKLQASQVPPPTLRFHEETKLLICAGTTQQLDLITQVLSGLTQMLQFPKPDSSKNTRKAGEIILPKLELKDASVNDALKEIQTQAVALDPEKKGVNVILNALGGHTVTLSLNDVPVLEALEYVAKQCLLAFEIRDHAILFNPLPEHGELQTGAAPAGGGFFREIPLLEKPGTSANHGGSGLPPSPGAPSAPPLRR